MSQVTSPVILDRTGQDIVNQLAAIASALGVQIIITGNTDTTLSGVLQGAAGKVAVMPVDATPTADSGNLVTSSGVKIALDGKANLGQIGYPESGTTASQNYTAGKYICWNGLLYTANQAIPIGTTLSAGTGGNLTGCVGGGFNNTASREWKFVRNIDAVGTNITSDLADRGYSEILLILADISNNIQLSSAVYPMTVLDSGVKCRTYHSYNGDIWFCGVEKINGAYRTELLTLNSIGRIYAR